MKQYFITGIGTNVGKTIVSAILTEALQADYWKPVQSGAAEDSDSRTVADLISNSRTKIYKESYLLKEPLSPHFAAIKENRVIDVSTITLPETNNTLIIEGAGGLMVPLNDKDYVIDLAKKFDSDVILVVSSYLGCINHSLLSIDYLMHHNYKIAGLILNGNFDKEVQDAILGYRPVKLLASVSQSEAINKEFIKKQAQQIDKTLFV